AAGAIESGAGFTPAALPLATPAPVPDPGLHIYNQYVTRVPAAMRDGLRAHLTSRRIGTEIYYPVPLHLQECFASLQYRRGALPEPEAPAAETHALPVYPELTRTQLDHVTSSVVEFLRSHRL